MKFRDNKNREWDLTLDAPTIRAIKQQFQINLTDLKSDPLETLESDPLLMVDAVWAICQTQATAAEVDEIDFAKSISGRADEMSEALAEAILNFFPVGVRSRHRSLLAEQKRLKDQQTQRQLERMREPAQVQKIQAAVDAQADRELDRILTTATTGTDQPG